jgi:hypothetical protein
MRSGGGLATVATVAAVANSPAALLPYLPDRRRTDFSLSSPKPSDSGSATFSGEGGLQCTPERGALITIAKAPMRRGRFSDPFMTSW